MAFKVVIADDHDIIREGIKSIIRQQSDYEIVGEAKDGKEALEKVKEKKPDIFLLDISMPEIGGLEIIETVKRISPNTKILIVSVHKAEAYIMKALRLGVKGYLNKENAAEDLIPALNKVSRGEIYLSSTISSYLIEKVSYQEKRGKKEISLTEREKEILRLVAEGKTAKEIAEVLYISPRTVENYKNNLLKKLSLHRTADLVKYAIEHKLVD
ncbi:MAG: DNA-binding response regulator [Candidatus Omnitrophota bacterium]|nr:MAG: DNA-binding response regulator [Candidatus Omnitrophota bacterium]